jgi:3-methyl-2-oxobutanoate hydroxymethyltransferase
MPAVRLRGVHRALVVVDLPFGTYQGNTKGALNSAIRIMKESGAHAVKLEGGREVLGSIERILTAGIPRHGPPRVDPTEHLQVRYLRGARQRGGRGPTPQSDAKLLEKAGCFALVLEKIPAQLAAEVAASVAIPVIGIGAGAKRGRPSARDA